MGSAGRMDRSESGLPGRQCGPLASAATRGPGPGVALYARPPAARAVQAARQDGRVRSGCQTWGLPAPRGARTRPPLFGVARSWVMNSSLRTGVKMMPVSNSNSPFWTAS